jgi:hypothetical protein
MLVRLKTSKSDEMALITYDNQHFSLRIKLRGKINKLGNLLQYLVQSITDLVSGWFSTTYEMFALCTHCTKQQQTALDPFLFPVPHIIQAITEKRRVVYCKDLDSRFFFFTKFFIFYFLIHLFFIGQWILQVWFLVKKILIIFLFKIFFLFYLFPRSCFS